MKDLQWRYLFYLLLFLISVGVCQKADASNHYIWAGATGSADGTDITNAFTDIPATLTRGDTYIVAGCGSDSVYSAYTFNDAVSTGLRITVRKLKTADSGVAGYQAAMVTQQAYFGILIFSTDYFTLDGSTGGGPGSWTSGHGFKIKGTVTGTKLIDIASDHVTITHTELEHNGMDNEENDNGIYSSSYSDSICISYNYLHDFGKCPLFTRYITNWTVEYNYIARNSSSPTQHSEAWASTEGTDVTVRYNQFFDIEGTGYIVGVNSDINRWDIYGNVFAYSYGNPYSRTGMGNGVIATTTGRVADSVKVYNNSFVNIETHGNIYIDGTGNEVFNNLWYDCNSVRITPDSSNYNVYADTPLAWDETAQPNDVETTGDQFVDWVNGDFALKIGVASIGAGKHFGSPYNVDYNSDTHPNPPDAGALIYSLGGAPPDHNAVTDLTGAAIGDNPDSLLYSFTKVVSESGSIDSIRIYLNDSTYVASSLDTNCVAFRLGGLTTNTEYNHHLRTYQGGEYQYSNSAAATTWHQIGFYVDADASAGGVGTPSRPFDALADINGLSPEPGDSVLFEKTDEFREMLTIPTSGTSGNNVFYGSYGSGANPIINAMDTKTAGDWSKGTLDQWDDFETGNNQAFWNREEGAVDTWTNFSVSAPVGGGIYGLELANTEQDEYQGWTAAGRELWFRADVKSQSEADSTKRGYICGIKDAAGMIAEIMFAGSGDTSPSKIRAYKYKTGTAAYLGSTSLSWDTWYQVKIRLKNDAADSTLSILQVWVDEMLEIDQVLTTVTTPVQDINIGNGGNYATVYMDNIWIGETDPGIWKPNVWETAFTPNSSVAAVVVDDTLYTKTASAATVDASGEYYIDSTNNIMGIFSMNDPDDRTTEVSARFNPVTTNGENYITIDNITVKGSITGGIQVQDSDNITVSNCTARHNWTAGIYVLQTDADSTVRAVTLTDNITYDNGINGIRTLTSSVLADSSKRIRLVTTSGNTSYNNGQGFYFVHTDSLTSTNDMAYDNLLLYDSNNERYGMAITSCKHVTVTGLTAYGNSGGFDTWGGSGSSNGFCSNIILQRSHLYNNTDYGARIGSGTNNSSFQYCIANDNTNWGLIPGGASSSYAGISMYNCLVANNGAQDAVFIGATAGVTLKNNIFWQRGAGLCLDIATGGGVDASSTNIYYKPAGGNIVENGASTYTSVNITGFEASALTSYPAFTDTVTFPADLTLTVDSPAVCAGTDVGLVLDYAGNPVPMPAGQLPDIGAYEEQTQSTTADAANRILTAGVPGKILGTGAVRNILDAGAP